MRRRGPLLVASGAPSTGKGRRCTAGRRLRPASLRIDVPCPLQRRRNILQDPRFRHSLNGVSDIERTRSAISIERLLARAGTKSGVGRAACALQQRGTQFEWQLWVGHVLAPAANQHCFFRAHCHIRKPPAFTPPRGIHCSSALNPDCLLLSSLLLCTWLPLCRSTPHCSSPAVHRTHG